MVEIHRLPVASGGKVRLVAQLADEIVRIEGAITAIHATANDADAEKAVVATVDDLMQRQMSIADEILDRPDEHRADLVALARAAMAVMEKNADGSIRARDMVERLAWRVIELVATPPQRDLDAELHAIAAAIAERHPADRSAASGLLFEAVLARRDFELFRHLVRPIDALVVDPILERAYECLDPEPSPAA